MGIPFLFRNDICPERCESIITNIKRFSAQPIEINSERNAALTIIESEHLKESI